MEWRRRRGLGVAELAGFVGVTPATIRRWERGETRPDPARLARLAAVLGKRPEDVLADCGPSHRLARFRVAAGLSQVAAARRLGVSRSSLRAYEQGRAAPPAHVRRMAAAYGVPLELVAAACGVEYPRELDPRTWRPGDLPTVLLVLRQWSGHTQAAVALQVGASKDSVRAWENGRTQPGPFLRARLEGMYRLPPTALLNAYARGGRPISLRSEQTLSEGAAVVC